MQELGGRIPESSTELRTLPGVGEYTCAAIASIAYGESIAVVDGNVERVLLRVTGTALRSIRLPDGPSYGRRPAALVPPKRLTDELNHAGDHNQAMMELGATICLPRRPLCLNCPVYELCRTRGEHLTAPRGKQRSQSVAHLLATRTRGGAGGGAAGAAAGAGEPDGGNDVSCRCFRSTLWKGWSRCCGCGTQLQTQIITLRSLPRMAAGGGEEAPG